MAALSRAAGLTVSHARLIASAGPVLLSPRETVAPAARPPVRDFVKRIGRQARDDSVARICKAETLKVASLRPGSAPVHLLVDSTELKLWGSSEWLLEKHGTRTRRSWRKLHIGVDADTG